MNIGGPFYAFANRLSPEMKKVAEENGLIEDGFVIVKAKDVLKPWTATVIFSKNGEAFTVDMIKEGVKHE